MAAKKTYTKQSKTPLKTTKNSVRSNRSSGTTFRGVYTPSGNTRKPKTASTRGGISSEKKMDLMGVFLLLLGLIIAMSLFAGSETTVTAWISALLRWFTGWGVWVVPFTLMIPGVYLILRKVDSLPRLPLEQVAGLVLLYLNLLTFFHYFGGGIAEPYLVAEQGSGGGILGGVILQVLVAGLGEIGAFLVLCAWLLIALIFSFDLSFQQIAQGFGGLKGAVKAAAPQGAGFMDTLRSGFTEWKDSLKEMTSADEDVHTEIVEPEAVMDGFTPIVTVKGAAEEAETALEAVETQEDLPAADPVWKLPEPEKILEKGSPQIENEKMDLERAGVIEETLADFGAPGHVVEILRGPSVTMFGVEPDFVENRSGNHTRVRVSKIVSLADDLALSLAATRIRIQAPVPGRNYVGIEVPNDHKAMVRLRDVVESASFKRIKGSLRIALGKDVSGVPLATDLAAMPHLLIAGTTGSGKSVCVNAILSCLLLNNTPDDLRLILVDPKRVEFTNYNGIPHLLAPVVVEADRVIGALQWMMREMDARYHKFAAAGARNLEDFNVRMQVRGEKKLPKLVIVIDELADLMMLAPAETQAAITRLAQMARATGLHLVVATQRPSTDVITGLIKANFPARVAFSVATMIDSRVILDQPGAEQLLGHGDMLFQAPDAPAPVRLQGVYVSDNEIQRLVDYWHGIVIDQAESGEGEEAPEALPPANMLRQVDFWQDGGGSKPNEDPLLTEVTELVRREGRASISMLQRRMRIGYTRAARLIDRMEELGIISGQLPNTQTREVLDFGQTAPPEDDGA